MNYNSKDLILNKKVGLSLKREIKKKGYTVISLTDKIGDIHKNTIYKIILGKSTPTIATLNKICEALEITMSDLFKGI